jgi:hypothetical protein
MRRTFLALAAAVSTAFAGLSTPAHAEGERFVLVSHAPDSDSWWNTIKNAITLAGQQMNVTVEYRNPPTGDLADMGRIIEQAAASNPNGIISTIADYDVLSGPLREPKSSRKRSARSCMSDSLKRRRAMARARRPRLRASSNLSASTTTSPTRPRWSAARAMPRRSAWNSARR